MNSKTQRKVNRRGFLRRSTALGSTSLASTAFGLLLADDSRLLGSDQGSSSGSREFQTGNPKAKRVISLFMSGGPSQCDLFDPKPELGKFADKPLPDSIRRGQRITTMTSKQDSILVSPSRFKFKRHGQCGMEISELMPHLSSVADELCMVRSMQTDAINHDPAITFFQTGSQIAGRPSIGSWVDYGLGSPNHNLPSYIAMTSQGGSGSQPLYSRLWGSGFLPTKYSGIKLRNSGPPVYFLSNPDGIDQGIRRDMLDDLSALNDEKFESILDPEIKNRMAQFEMAFRMQTSIPELADISDEPEHILKMYGPDVRRPGTYARNCLLARRLAERDVRFIQLFHMGWDHHTKIAENIPKLCRSSDQPTAALINDLKQRGLLDDTLIVWGGEFGRTIYAQDKGNKAGRDHHPYCFTSLLAGAGVKSGKVYGATDEFSYNVATDRVHVHDLNATILHLLGIDHERLTFKYQGRQYRLTDVHGKVVKGLLN